MVRFLALFVLAASTPLAAAPPPRNFTVTSFDRVRVEAPYAITLSSGRAPFARAEGPAAALDAIDLRVEGRTLIVRRRSGSGSSGASGPVRISLGTHELRSASLMGSGSLVIDRMSGLSAQLSVAGPGSLSVREVAADRLNAGVQGSGSLSLSGQVKTAVLSAMGAPTLSASAMMADELTLSAEGTGEVAAAARSRANVVAAGTVQVRLSGGPACVLEISGSAAVEGCKTAR